MDLRRLGVCDTRRRFACIRDADRRVTRCRFSKSHPWTLRKIRSESANFQRVRVPGLVREFAAPWDCYGFESRAGDRSLSCLFDPLTPQMCALSLVKKMTSPQSPHMVGL
jgi:hypothetical protein